MKIAVVKEQDTNEQRAAASPETVKQLVKLGFDVTVEKGTGDGASMADAQYKDAGATIATTSKTAVKDAGIVLAVRAPAKDAAFLADIPKSANFIAMFAPYDNPDLLKELAANDISALSLELMPRITRAQSMDVLSSQSNLAGYRGVIDGAHEFGRAFPMMMTAAGTIPPARVLVLGAGVAGLQAIATAKRLGAIVTAFDVRAAAAEQVESLGASFIKVEAAADAETKGGYAKEMDDDYKQRQRAAIIDALEKTDIVITTALIPGRPAPELLDEEMVKVLKAGSVVVDLAAERGGNCALTTPGKIVTKHGVKILGYTNVPGRLAADATRLYAKNVFNLVKLLKDAATKNEGSEDEGIKLDTEDEIIQGILLTHGGKLVHPKFGGEAKEEEATEASTPANTDSETEEKKAS